MSPLSILATASMLALAAALPTSTLDTRAPHYVQKGPPLPETTPSFDTPVNHFCNNFPTAPTEQSLLPVSEFRMGMQEGGQQCVGAGPNACMTVSSNAISVVSYCNNNPYPKCVDNSDIVFRLYALTSLCITDPDISEWSGQAFFGDNTNVLVRAA